MSVSTNLEYPYGSGTVSLASSAKLDATHIVNVFRDGTNSNLLTAIVGTLSGTSVTYGTKVALSATAPSNLEVIVLDATHFVINWMDGTYPTYTKSVCCVVSGGTVVTFGAIVSASASNFIGFGFSGNVLDSTHFVVNWFDNNDSFKAYSAIGTVTGTTIVFGSQYLISNTGSGTISSCSLDATHIAYTVTVGTSSSLGVIGVVSGGNVITIGSPTTMLAASNTSGGTRTLALDSTHFVTNFVTTTQNYTAAIVGTVTGGNVLAYGTVVAYKGGQNQALGKCAKLDSTHFAVAFGDVSNSSRGTIVRGTVSNGDVLSFENTYTFTNNQVTYAQTLSDLSSSQCYISYVNQVSTYGVVQVVTFGANIQNSQNTYLNNVSDGFDITGGTLSRRKLTVSGGDVGLIGSSSNKNLTLNGNLTVNNSLTLAGTDATTMTFPSTTAQVARIDAAQTFTGLQTFASQATNNGGFYLKDLGGVYRIQFYVNETNTGTKTLYIKLNNPASGSRNFNLYGDLTVGGNMGIAWAKYSFGTDGGAVSTITPGVLFNTTIPDNSIITAVIINSTTALASGGSATISIGTSAGSSTTSLLGTTAYTTFTLDKLSPGVPTFNVPIKMTAGGNITFTIGTAPLTAGVIEVFVYFYTASA